MPFPRNPKNWCLHCDKQCTGSKSNLCNVCFAKQNTIIYGSKSSKGDFVSTYARHRYQNIRHHAHRVMSNESKVCKICGYSLHVELAHIKSISSFPENALLNEINQKENLIFLCRNHHWETENGHLSLAGMV